MYPDVEPAESLSRSAAGRERRSNDRSTDATGESVVAVPVEQGAIPFRSAAQYWATTGGLVNPAVQHGTEQGRPTALERRRFPNGAVTMNADVRGAKMIEKGQKTSAEQKTSGLRPNCAGHLLFRVTSRRCASRPRGDLRRHVRRAWNVRLPDRNVHHLDARHLRPALSRKPVVRAQR